MRWDDRGLAVTRYRGARAFLVSAFALAIASSVPSTAASVPTAPTNDQFIGMARAVLQSEYEALITGTPPQGTHVTISEHGVSQNPRQRAMAIAYRRAFNAKYGVQFTKATFELADASVTRSGSVVRLSLWERFERESVVVGTAYPPETTTGLRPHTFEFQLDADRGWVVTSHADAPIPSNRFEPDAVGRSLPSGGRTTQLRGASSLDDRPAKAGLAKPLAAGTYDRNAAKAYATQWAATYNPNYRNFESDGNQGGDCTNFASQVLKAGGWQNKCEGCSYLDWKAWWYIFLPGGMQTRTWTYAPALKYFLETQGRAHVYWYFEDLRIGDVLSLDFGADGTIDHTMVVDDRYAPGTAYIFMSYHTYPTYHERLSDVLARRPPDSNAYFGWSIDGTY